MCVCIPVYLCLYEVPTEAKASELLELELQVGVNHMVWVLGAEHRSSERAANTFNC